MEKNPHKCRQNPLYHKRWIYSKNKLKCGTLKFKCSQCSFRNLQYCTNRYKEAVLDFALIKSSKWDFYNKCLLRWKPSHKHLSIVSAKKFCFIFSELSYKCCSNCPTFQSCLSPNYSKDNSYLVYNSDRALCDLVPFFRYIFTLRYSRETTEFRVFSQRMQLVIVSLLLPLFKTSSTLFGLSVYVTWSRGMSRMSAILILRYWQKQCSNSFVLCYFYQCQVLHNSVTRYPIVTGFGSKWSILQLWESGARK